MDHLGELLTALLAALTALIGYLNRRELKPRKKRRDRTTGAPKPKDTLGDRVEGLTLDMPVLKDQVTELQTSFLKHLIEHNDGRAGK